METKVTSPIIKGLVISLVLIVFSVIGQLTDLDVQSWYRWLSMLLFFGAIIYGCILYANQNHNNVTFGNVFADGFKTSAITACITIVFTILLFLVMPELKQRLFDNALREAEKGGQPEEAVEKGMEIFKKMFWPFMIGGIMVTYLLLGVIASLIGAAIAKKQPLDPFQQPLQ